MLKESELFGQSMSLSSPFISVREDINDNVKILCKNDQFALKTDIFGARRIQLLVDNGKMEEAGDNLCTLAKSVITYRFTCIPFNKIYLTRKCNLAESLQSICNIIHI